jgi:hypothetical protein
VPESPGAAEGVEGRNHLGDVLPHVGKVIRLLRFVKYGPENSFIRSAGLMSPPAFFSLKPSHLRTCSSDRKKFMVLQE